MSNARNPKEQKLEAMLQARLFGRASRDLAERIAREARLLPPNQTVAVTQWMKGLFAEFHLPRPVYVLVSTLIFGFVVGFTIPQYTTIADDTDSISVQSFLYADEDVL